MSSHMSCRWEAKAAAMMGSKVMHFHKYHGAGNDFVFVDNMNGYFDAHLDNSALIRNICHRRLGVGSDGFIALLPHANAAFEMLYFNSDGRKGVLCGNGCRCAIAFAKYLKLFPGKEVSFWAFDGRHDGIYESDERIHVKMADVSDITRYDDQNYFVFTGAPHLVHFVQALDTVDVQKLGRDLRFAKKYEEFDGTNVNFVQGQPDGSLRIRTYERGVEEETLACGTGAVASALVYNCKCNTNGPDASSLPTVTKLHATGGELSVSFERVGTSYRNIYLTGPACHVFSGQYYL